MGFEESLVTALCKEGYEAEFYNYEMLPEGQRLLECTSPLKMDDLNIINSLNYCVSQIATEEANKIIGINMK